MGNIISKKRRFHDLELPLLDVGRDTIHMTIDDKLEVLEYMKNVNNRLDNMDHKIVGNTSQSDQYKMATNEEIYNINEKMALLQKDLQNLLENDKILLDKISKIENMSERSASFIEDPYYSTKHNNHPLSYENIQESPFLDE